MRPARETAPPSLRQAAAKNGRRLLLILLTMGVAILTAGALAGAALVIVPSILTGSHASDLAIREILVWAAGGAVLLAAAAAVAIATRIATIDDRILEDQGAVEIRTRHSGLAHDPLLIRLREAVEETARAAGIPTPRIFVVEDPALNAFSVGARPDRAAIAATRGLLESLSQEELGAVMAHEIAHLALGDARLTTATAAVASLVQGTIEALRPSEIETNVYLLPLALIRIAALLPLVVLGLLFLAILRAAASRQQEYRADATAARLRRDPTALARALGKIDRNPHVRHASHAASGLYIVCPFLPSTYESLLHRHPPTAIRIARLFDLRPD